VTPPRARARVTGETHPGIVSVVEVTSLRLSCEEFDNINSRIPNGTHTLSQSLQNTELPSFSASNVTAVNRAFRPGTTLHRLLSSRLEDRRGTSFRRSPRLQSLYRLASLIYIYAVLRDYHQSLELTDQYVGWLQGHIEDRNASLNPAQLKRQRKLTKLEKDTNDDDNSSGLSFEPWNKVNEILFHGLMDISVAKQFDLRWNAEQIRVEIASDRAPGG
jgi:hypothetical protein